MAGDRSGSHDTPVKYASPPTSGKKSHKRKRDLDGSTISSSTPTKKSKKDRSEPSTPVSDKKSKKKERTSSVSVDKPSKEANSKDSTKKKSAVSPVSEKTKSDDVSAKRKKKAKSEERRTAEKDSDADEKPADLKEEGHDTDKPKKAKSKDSTKAKKYKQSETADDAEDDGGSNRTKNKFAGILSKFERSAKVKEAAAEKGHQKESSEEDDNAAEPVVAQGLEPIPQPAPVLEEAEKPTYSSLPAWLANPLRTPAETRTKFADLGIDPKLLRVLQDNGYKDAFAVQSAVIPLLLKGANSHSGDLCVSAATGSGKTLSYVLPLVTELEQIPAPRLRGLIVVPTRELVKQAREACELCTAGTGLRVGSAVGNVAIKDEQRSLMRADQVYSPGYVESRQTAQLTGDEWTDFSLQDYISSTTDLGVTLPGYVHKVEPNVDILICTPGRLVDHLRYTKGFTLKHLQWLVIDEADRLLNESFQEWVDVVMRSLEARKDSDAFGSTGQFLAGLGLPLQTKEPRKVILSATMTRDISKLNTLRLTKPRLVIVGAADRGDTAEGDSGVVALADERFSLPTTLKEYSVAVGDGAQKPLYLLRLLLDEIKLAVPSSAKAKKPAPSESDETSSEGTSSDEINSDESSSEDETSSDESESDPESDSSDDSSSEDSDSSDSDSESESDVEEPTKTPTNTPQRSTVLIFTKSSESASRLSRLLALLDPSLSGLIGTIIKSNKSSASRKTLSAYRQGKLSIIIATDRASRGLDLQSLTHVINYDIPASITTYVHRVGRTARAGKEGSAWTLVAHREGRWFTNEISKGAEGKITRATKVERVSMKLNNMKEVKSRYASALDVLEKEVKAGGAKKSVR
ncbi:P-loop containing nucleoside triphosphate hydrolase protein [Aspergillus venezuelensis]